MTWDGKMRMAAFCGHLWPVQVSVDGKQFLEWEHGAPPFIDLCQCSFLILPCKNDGMLELEHGAVNTALELASLVLVGEM